MIQATLQDYFLSKARPPREHKDRFYPTQASTYIDYKTYKKLEGKCMRAAYYHCNAVPIDSEFSLTTNLIFDIGDYVESMILDKLDKAGILFEKSTKFSIKKYSISGRLDAILIDKETGVKTGLEVKSIGSNKYTYQAVYGSRWNKPFPKWQNLFQTLVYCYAFRDTIDKFILLYIRRDTCEIKEFEISLMPKNKKLYACIDGKIDERFCIDDILKRYKMLQGYIEREELPEKEYQPTYKRQDIPTYQKLGVISKWQADKYSEAPFGDFECRYCDYASKCKEDK